MLKELIDKDKPSKFAPSGLVNKFFPQLTAAAGRTSRAGCTRPAGSSARSTGRTSSSGRRSRPSRGSSTTTRTITTSAQAEGGGRQGLGGRGVEARQGPRRGQGRGRQARRRRPRVGAEYLRKSDNVPAFEKAVKDALKDKPYRQFELKDPRPARLPALADPAGRRRLRPAADRRRQDPVPGRGHGREADGVADQAARRDGGDRRCAAAALLRLHLLVKAPGGDAGQVPQRRVRARGEEPT